MASYYSSENPNISPKRSSGKKIVISSRNAFFEYEFVRNRDGDDLEKETICDFKLFDVNLIIRKVINFIICINENVN